MCDVCDAGYVLKQAGEGKVGAFLRADGSGIVFWAQSKKSEFKPYVAHIRRILPAALGPEASAQDLIFTVRGTDLAGLMGRLGVDVKRPPAEVVAWTHDANITALPLKEDTSHKISGVWDPTADGSLPVDENILKVFYYRPTAEELKEAMETLPAALAEKANKAKARKKSRKSMAPEEVKSLLGLTS